MDNKDLIARFVGDSYRFETLHEEIDSLIAEADSEILAYEYEDLANQAAEIVLKLSANGKNVGERFFHYYVERLEYIIDYFRALLDYEETPLAEDEQDELDDEKARTYRRIDKFFTRPAEIRFEGDPADSAFPKSPIFYIKKMGIQVRPDCQFRRNAAPDEPDAVEEDDSKDEQPDEVDDENAARTAESDEDADDVDRDAFFSLDEVSELLSKAPDFEGLSSVDRDRVRDTFAMWYEMNDITGRNRGDGDFAEAVKELDNVEWLFTLTQYCLREGLPNSLVHNEQSLRERINRAINEIPGFRDSEEFKKLTEEYPTYKELMEQ